MSNGQDHENLSPMLDGAKENIKVIGKGDDYFKGKELSADANYHSNSNLQKSAKEKRFSLSQKMKEKIDTDEGKAIYSKRFAIIEPVFANILSQKRLDRFTYRGKVKVNIQWMLYCLVHNIEKIINYGLAG